MIVLEWLTFCVEVAYRKQSKVAYIWGWHPPFLVRSIQGEFRQYPVRKGSVRSMQKFCYIVRSHQFLL